MPTKSCIFVGCDNNSRTTPNKIFISVPKEFDRRKLWFQAAGKPATLKGGNYFCCEDHFNLEYDAINWSFYKQIGTKLKIKEDVVPRSYLSKEITRTTSQLTPLTKQRKEEAVKGVQTPQREVRRQLFQEEAGPSTSTETVLQASPSGVFHVERSPKKLVPFRAKKTKFNKWTMTKKTKSKDQASVARPDTAEKGTMTTAALQVQTVKEGTSTSSHEATTDAAAVSDDQSTSTWNSDSSINAEVILKTEIYKIEHNPRLYLGIPQDSYYVIKLLEKDFDQIHLFVTLKKIRLNDSFQRLGIDFARSTSGVNWIFHKTIPVLAQNLRQLIFWPEKKKIQELQPSQFQSFHKNVEGIIDCFEVEIEKPSAALKQALTWSEYKKCNTAKFLVSVTPAGLVTFISAAFTGRTSDLEIIEKSGYIDIVPEGATIMADRGFKNIGHILERKHVQLVRPPSVSSKMKMTKYETQLTKVIAALRIHVERLIRRIREFAMLGPHACTHHRTVPLLDDIVVIVCALVNLQGPLIK